MPDTEKLTINLSVVDLGKIDLLIDQGLYSTRTDAVRSAVRNLMDKHTSELSQAVARTAAVVGVISYDRKALEAVGARNERLNIMVVGMLGLSDDVTPDLARAVFASIRVLGVFRASAEIKAALADRTT